MSVVLLPLQESATKCRTLCLGTPFAYLPCESGKKEKRKRGDKEEQIKKEDLEMFPVRGTDFPFSVLGRMFDDAFTPTRREYSVPSVNISEDEKAYHVELAAPGMKKEDFSIHVDNGTLSISTEKEERREETDKGEGKEGAKCILREYNYSSFHRSFRLPEDVDCERVEASYEDGELKVLLPKREVDPNAGMRQIAVK